MKFKALDILVPPSSANAGSVHGVSGEAALYSRMQVFTDPSDWDNNPKVLASAEAVNKLVQKAKEASVRVEALDQLLATNRAAYLKDLTSLRNHVETLRSVAEAAGVHKAFATHTEQGLLMRLRAALEANQVFFYDPIECFGDEDTREAMKSFFALAHRRLIDENETLRKQLTSLGFSLDELSAGSRSPEEFLIARIGVLLKTTSVSEILACLPQDAVLKWLAGRRPSIKHAESQYALSKRQIFGHVGVTSLRGSDFQVTVGVWKSLTVHKFLNFVREPSREFSSSRARPLVDQGLPAVAKVSVPVGQSKPMIDVAGLPENPKVAVVERPIPTTSDWPPPMKSDKLQRSQASDKTESGFHIIDSPPISQHEAPNARKVKILEPTDQLTRGPPVDEDSSKDSEHRDLFASSSGRAAVPAFASTDGDTVTQLASVSDHEERENRNLLDTLVHNKEKKITVGPAIVDVASLFDSRTDESSPRFHPFGLKDMGLAHGGSNELRSSSDDEPPSQNTDDHRNLQFDEVTGMTEYVKSAPPNAPVEPRKTLIIELIKSVYIEPETSLMSRRVTSTTCGPKESSIGLAVHPDPAPAEASNSQDSHAAYRQLLISGSQDERSENLSRGFDIRQFAIDTADSIFGETSDLGRSTQVSSFLRTTDDISWPVCGVRERERQELAIGGSSVSISQRRGKRKRGRTMTEVVSRRIPDSALITIISKSKTPEEVRRRRRKASNLQ